MKQKEIIKHDQKLIQKKNYIYLTRLYHDSDAPITRFRRDSVTILTRYCPDSEAILRQLSASAVNFRITPGPWFVLFLDQAKSAQAKKRTTEINIK